MSKQEVESLEVGDSVAVEVGDAGEGEVSLGVLESKHEAQASVVCKNLAASGPGPWIAKIWGLEHRGGAVVKTHHPLDRIIARVEMQNNRLSPGSVELLRSRGVGI